MNQRKTFATSRNCMPFMHRTVAEIDAAEEAAASDLDDWGRERRCQRPPHREQGAAQSDEAKRNQLGHGGAR